MKIKIDFTIPVVLAIVFVVLKLCGVIAWSWVWVLSPLWIGAIIDLIIIAIFFWCNRPRNTYSSKPSCGGRALIWDPVTKELY